MWGCTLELLQLGDPDNKAASNADFHLANLLSDHPNMKVWIFIVLCFNLLILNIVLGVSILYAWANVYCLLMSCGNGYTWSKLKKKYKLKSFSCLIWFPVFFFLLSQKISTISVLGVPFHSTIVYIFNMLNIICSIDFLICFRYILMSVLLSNCICFLLCRLWLSTRWILFSFGHI